MLPEMKPFPNAEGVLGTVLRLRGDWMPSNGQPTGSQQLESVQTMVWVFAGKIKSDCAPWWNVADARQHRQLLGWVKSDTRGKFSVSLPPGDYTLFAQYGDRLYLNLFDEDGNYRSVHVEPMQISEMSLVNTNDLTC